MNLLISKIKSQYFSTQNIDFLVDMIRNKYEIKEKNYQDKLFKIQNKIYNNFFETFHNKNVHEQPTILDEILIELNKLTIQFYLTPEVLDTYPNLNLDTKYYQTKDEYINPIVNTPIINTPNVNTPNVNTPNVNTLMINTIVTPITYLDLYSSSSKYESKLNEYEFIFDIPLQNFYVKQFKIYSTDIFNNINEYNNKVELTENTNKVKISIIPGNYSIQELTEVLQRNINEKSIFKSYKIIYNKNKNRVQISSDKHFNIKFIENQINNVQLKNILGYSKNEYCSNCSYSSENEPNIIIHKEIYIKIKNESSLNRFHTNIIDESNINFKYFHKYGINDYHSKFILEKPIYKIILQLYYKSDNELFKFIKKVDYNILLECK